MAISSLAFPATRHKNFPLRGIKRGILCAAFAIPEFTSDYESGVFYWQKLNHKKGMQKRDISSDFWWKISPRLGGVVEGGDPIALQFQHQINIDLHCVALQCIFCIIISNQYTLLVMLKPCNTILNAMQAM